MALKITSRGSFKNTERFLKRMSKDDIYATLETYAQIGQSALESATPVDSGETARSWSYSIVVSRKGRKITWYNSHMAGTVPVAILIQYGHATGTGGYVQGRDFINPAIRPIFDQMAESVWKEVQNS